MICEGGVDVFQNKAFNAALSVVEKINRSIKGTSHLVGYYTGMVT